MAPLDPQGQGGAGPGLPTCRVVAAPEERATPTTPFVGRESRDGRGWRPRCSKWPPPARAELLTVVGDAGVGKSRLIREFAERATAQERSQVVRGRCLPYGDGITFWPLAEIVRRAAGYADEDSRDEVALGKILDSLVARRRSRRRERDRRSRRVRDRPVDDTVSRAGVVLGHPQAARVARNAATARHDHRRYPLGGADIPRAPRPPARCGARLADARAHDGAPRALRDARRMGRRT